MGICFVLWWRNDQRSTWWPTYAKWNTQVTRQQVDNCLFIWYVYCLVVRDVSYRSVSRYTIFYIQKLNRTPHLSISVILFFTFITLYISPPFLLDGVRACERVKVVCGCVCMCVFPSVYLSIYLSVYLYIYIYIYICILYVCRSTGVHVYHFCSHVFLFHRYLYLAHTGLREVLIYRLSQNGTLSLRQVKQAFPCYWITGTNQSNIWAIAFQLHTHTYTRTCTYARTHARIYIYIYIYIWESLYRCKSICKKVIRFTCFH